MEPTSKGRQRGDENEKGEEGERRGGEGDLLQGLRGIDAP